MPEEWVRRLISTMNAIEQRMTALERRVTNMERRSSRQRADTKEVLTEIDSLREQTAHNSELLQVIATPTDHKPEPRHDSTVTHIAKRV